MTPRNMRNDIFHHLMIKSLIEYFAKGLALICEHKGRPSPSTFFRPLNDTLYSFNRTHSLFLPFVGPLVDPCIYLPFSDVIISIIALMFTCTAIVDVSLFYITFIQCIDHSLMNMWFDCLLSAENCWIGQSHRKLQQFNIHILIFTFTTFATIQI